MMKGIDVSKWQGKIDWKTASRHVDFCIARAAFGTSIDPSFERNWRGMADCGVIRGVYQYLRVEKDPVAQAHDLLELLADCGGLHEGDLSPVADVERETNEGAIAAQWEACIYPWTQEIESHLGRRPILYTGPVFWEDVGLGDMFAHLPLWLADYRRMPHLPKDSWKKYLLWQYTNRGAVPGIQGNVDCNHLRWNGWEDFIRARMSMQASAQYDRDRGSLLRRIMGNR